MLQDLFHKDILLALFTEMGELAECYHWLSDEEVSQVHLDLNKKKNIEEEVADVFIYLLIFCHKTDIDLLKVFKEKMEKNKLKYPSDKMKGVHSNPLMGFKGK